MQYVIALAVCINLLGVIVTCVDKRRAITDGWRIPERTLFLLCALGGCPGVYLTMRKIRHKTLHKRFMWGIPAIFILQILLCFSLYWFLLRRLYL